MKTLLVLLMIGSSMAFAAEPAPVDKADVKTGVHPTKEDLETTTAIRKAVVADKSLSVAAHNVKIFTEKGKVTLRGPVKSDAEVASVVEKAVAVAGKEKVVSELEVKP